MSDWLDALVANGCRRLEPLQKELREKHNQYRSRRCAFKEYADLFIRRFWTEGLYVELTREEAVSAAKRVAEKTGEHLHAFTRELIMAAKSLGWRCVVISGSTDFVVEAVLQPLDVDCILATSHPMDENGRFRNGDVKDQVRAGKGASIRNYLEEQGLDSGILRHSIAIGDTPADADMMKLVGYPICFNPNRELDAMTLERGWPIVVEERNVHYVLKMIGDRQIRVGLQGILPAELADALSARLCAMLW